MISFVLLPLLSIATLAGAQASVAEVATLDVAAQAAGAQAQAELGSNAPSPPQRNRIVVRDYAVPVPPQSIDFQCPLETGFNRSVDLSTGGPADWRVAGTGIGSFQSPFSVDANAVPAAWNVPLENAKWLRVVGEKFAVETEYPYRFTTLFRVLKSPGEMRLTLKGRVLADEKFTLELFEPEPETGPADHPSQWGANADAPNPAQLTARDIFDVDLLIGEAVFQNKPSGSKNPRVGVYRLVVTVENSAGHADAVAMLAQLELKQTCLSWGAAKSVKKRGKKKKN